MSDTKAARDWLGTKEAAHYLGVSIHWIRMRKKELPPSYKVGGLNRYLRSDIEAWLEKHRVAKP